MFTKELSIQMLKTIDKRKLTIENVSDAAGLSRKFVSNIVNGKQVPTLESFEKICSALELEPNDLLLNPKSKQEGRREPMQVNTVYCSTIERKNANIPVCPNCQSLLMTERQGYCDNCGQKLSWQKYAHSKIVFEKPKRI